MFRNLTTLIGSRFPDTMIIPTFGNNDAYTDYEPPGWYVEKNEGTNPDGSSTVVNVPKTVPDGWVDIFYEALMYAWFMDIPANKKYIDKLS